MKKKATKLRPPGPLVLVEWDDILEDPTWLEERPEGRLFKCVTVGFLTRKDAKMVVLATSFGDDESPETRLRKSGGVISIPRGAVTRIRKVVDPR